VNIEKWQPWISVGALVISIAVLIALEFNAVNRENRYQQRSIDRLIDKVDELEFGKVYAAK
jgi:hypothetical protein